jgi:hypothetical protein
MIPNETKFLAWISEYRGVEPVISVASFVCEFDGADVFKINGAVRAIHPFERMFDTRAEAVRWCAGEIERMARALDRKVSEMLEDARQEEAAHGVV